MVMTLEEHSSKFLNFVAVKKKQTKNPKRQSRTNVLKNIVNIFVLCFNQRNSVLN